MGQIYFRISLFDVLSVGKIMYIFFKKQHGLVHLTKFHLETAASVNGRAPHLIISKDIARPLTIPLPVRRTEFRPQEFTPNFVLPVTHEMYIQPYLKYCLESNSYTFESNASRLHAYLWGLVFKTRRFIPVTLAQRIVFYSSSVS